MCPLAPLVRVCVAGAQTPQQAQEYVDRKLGLVQENAEKLQQALLTKRKNLEAIVGVMQEKMAQQPAQ
jgi:hypothetical protein